MQRFVEQRFDPLALGRPPVFVTAEYHIPDSDTVYLQRLVVQQCREVHSVAVDRCGYCLCPVGVVAGERCEVAFRKLRQQADTPEREPSGFGVDAE